MLAEQIIDNQVPVVKSTDSCVSALRNIQIFECLPVLDNGIFLGLVSYAQLVEADKNQQVGSLDLDKFFILPQRDILEVADLFSTGNHSIIPIVKDDGHYVGTVSARKFFSEFAGYSLHCGGKFITIEVGCHDYYLSEIAKILEDENSTILSLFTNSMQNKIYITLILECDDILRAISSLQRYDYNVISYFSKDIDATSAEDNYDYLVNYLNI